MEWYGSVQNRIDEGKQSGEPFVGMGATEMCYSDREPYTVQKVVSPSRVVVTPDKWTRVDSNGRSECQSYEYESAPLLVGEKKPRCTHMLWIQVGIDKCGQRCEGGCEGCKWFEDTAPTNGVTLVKTKRGWKALGQDRRFSLGIRERYEDPSF